MQRSREQSNTWTWEQSKTKIEKNPPRQEWPAQLLSIGFPPWRSPSSWFRVAVVIPTFCWPDPSVQRRRQLEENGRMKSERGTQQSKAVHHLFCPHKMHGRISGAEDTYIRLFDCINWIQLEYIIHIQHNYMCLWKLIKVTVELDLWAIKPSVGK